MEAGSPIRHEYANGDIFAMAGASVAGNHVAANILTHLRTALRGTPCAAFGSELRLATPSGLYTYPDVMVISGPPTLVSGRPDTVTNPALLVEVLSEATRDYDRGEKLVAYQAIPTLRELLLVEQDAVAVERIHRTAAGTWLREGGGAAGCGRASRIGRRPAAARRGLPRGVRRGPDKGPKLTR